MGFDGFQHQNSKRGTRTKFVWENLKTVKTHQTSKPCHPRYTKGTDNAQADALSRKAKL